MPMKTKDGHCRRCGGTSCTPGSGRLPAPGRRWYKFFEEIICPDCNGTGYQDGIDRRGDSPQGDSDDDY